MSTARHVKLFKNGRSQALRIPREFELPGTEAVIRRDGEKLVIEPILTKPRTLSELLASWEPLDEEIGPIDDLPTRPVNL